MDEIGYRTLKAELEADCDVIECAASDAKSRFGTASATELEACAFQLVRCYNAIEQMGLRIAKACENNIDDEKGWHVELIRRLSLSIPEVRPALFPKEIIADLGELRGFRHVVVHAYDLVLKKDRMTALLDASQRVSVRIRDLTREFLEQLAKLL